MKGNRSPPGGRLKARRANDCRVPAERVENDGKESKEPAPANDDLERRRRELERSAAQRVTPWGKPQKEDYDFAWIKGASIEVLESGRIYEYARESPKLRGLLVLVDPKRKRKPFEIETRPRTGTQLRLPCSFQGLHQEDAGRTLGSALRWLSRFAGELADNQTFAQLLRSRENEMKRLIPKLRLRFPLKPMELATPSFLDYGPPPWPWRPWMNVWVLGEAGAQVFPDRKIEDDGSEKIAITVRWRDFRNSEIAKEMNEFATHNRPPSEPQPKRKGQRPKETIRADLKALSVMRIWKLHADKPWKRLDEVANVCRYKGCRREAAEYKRRRKAWDGMQPMSQAAKTEMSEARSRALSFFRRLFPEQKPSNY